MTPAEAIDKAEHLSELGKRIEAEAKGVRAFLAAYANLAGGAVRPNEPAPAALPMPEPKNVIARWKSLRDGKDGLATRWQAAPFNLSRPQYAAISGAINEAVTWYSVGGDVETYGPTMALIFDVLEHGGYDRLPPAFTVRFDSVWKKLLAAEQ